MSAPSLLSNMQDSFSDTLRLPLIDHAGALLDQNLSKGLGAYHRQYWMRLFTVLQGQFPLLSKLVGAKSFNVLVQGYLLEHAPSHRDLGEIPLRLLDYGESRLDEREREALQIDFAFWRCFRAPEDEALRVESDAIAQLAGQRLTPRASVAIVREHWNLMEVRAEAGAMMPTRLVEPVPWVVYRGTESIRFERLAPFEAKLLEWMAEMSLSEALARVQEDTGEEALAKSVGTWLGRAVSREHWRAR